MSYLLSDMYICTCKRVVNLEKGLGMSTIQKFMSNVGTIMERFPVGFLIGIATSSYQIEGGWDTAGKGESIWDRLVHLQPHLIQDKSNGDISANSYELYKKDVDIIKEIGLTEQLVFFKLSFQRQLSLHKRWQFDFYRFSISWPRILPTGEAHLINKEGLNYYNNLIDELLKNGIQPMVTMYHWDLPQKLQDMGGWLNPLIVDYFEEYAGVLFEYFGDKVKFWITINEPFEITSGYGDTEVAPMLDLHGVGEYLAGHHLLKAHAKAFRLYETKFRSHQKGKISFGISGKYAFPRSDSVQDKEAAERIMQFTIGWFAHPIHSTRGDYPEVMKKTILENSIKEGRSKSRLPSFSNEEINLIKGTCDFFAYQHYTSNEVTLGHEGKEPSIYRDSNVITTQNQNWISSNLGWLKNVPEGLRFALKWIKENYNSPEIFITENGYGEFDEKDLEDDNRINYFTGYLKQLLKSIEVDKCNVIGYTAWTLLDNFEWLAGYSAKFGIVHVDFEDPGRKRTLKKSALFFKEILKSREI